jgi:hypothetical protein
VTRSRLNEKQVAVLTWVGEGCPDDRWSDFTYKTTAVALQSRRMVTVSKHAGGWSAEITAAGRYYLQHEEFPPDATRKKPARAALRPPEDASAAATPVRPQRVARPAISGVGAQLVAELLAGAGVLSITAEQRPVYERRIAHARKGDHVPAGKLLELSREDTSGWQVRLIDAPEWMTAVLRPIEIPDQLRGVHPVVAALREDRNRLVFAAPVRQSALRILEALAREAFARGWKVAGPNMQSGNEYRDVHPEMMTFTAQGHDVGVTVRQLTDRVPHIPTKREAQDAALPWGHGIRVYDQVPNGKLSMTLVGGVVHRQGTWRLPQDDALPAALAQILHEVELRVHAAEQVRLERERARIERDAAWRTAVAAATARVIEDHRVGILLDQVTRWQRTQALGAYLEQLRSTVATITDDAAREDAVAWLAWAEEHRARLDPLTEPIRMPDDPPVSQEDLRPFLNGWSPRGPYGDATWARPVR